MCVGALEVMMRGGVYLGGGDGYVSHRAEWGGIVLEREE